MLSHPVEERNLLLSQTRLAKRGFARAVEKEYCYSRGGLI
jgi:hypothetical protein